MIVVFVRHGEKRRGESDPELTSAGRRMAAETGRWIQAQGWIPSLVVTTPTERTRQTVEELALALEVDVPVEERDLPELSEDLVVLLEGLLVRRPSLTVALCVGHHPMIDLIKRRYAVPVAVPRVHFASAIALQVDEPGSARCVAAWPGRPSF
jgi:phosphohistidine phosphatase SixA